MPLRATPHGIELEPLEPGWRLEGITQLLTATATPNWLAAESREPVAPPVTMPAANGHIRAATDEDARQEAFWPSKKPSPGGLHTAVCRARQAIGDEEIEDAIWAYDGPHDEVCEVVGLLALPPENVTPETSVDRFALPRG